MAKRKARAGVNRSEAIRAYLADHPSATAGEIIPALAEQGVTVSKNLVSNVKYHAPKGKKGSRAAGRKNMGRKRRTAGGGKSLTAENLFEAKRFVDEVGSIQAARSALDALEELQ